MPLRLGIVAPLVFGTSGFARAGRQIMFGLSNLGIDIRLYGVKEPKYDRIITREEYERLCQFAVNNGQPDIWFNLAPQCGFALDGSYRGWKVGMSMFETYENPPSFIAQCQRCDEIWVPSVFCFDVFHRSSHVPKERLSYMPLGVDTKVFSPRPSKVYITDETLVRFNYVYGIVCGYSMRKGVDLVLTAHHELFTFDSRVALFVKGDSYGARLFPKDAQTLYKGESLVDLSDKPEEVRRSILSKTQKNKPVMLYSFDSLNDLELAEIFLAMDGFVFPSRGEGFGLPPLEAMSCGIPVVGTAATGMQDFMFEDISYPVRSKGWKPEPRCYWITPDYRGKLFADPDYEQYRDMVWEMYSDREGATSKGKKAREFVVKNFSIEVTTARMKRRLEEIASGRTTTENFWPGVTL